MFVTLTVRWNEEGIMSIFTSALTLVAIKGRFCEFEHLQECCKRGPHHEGVYAVQQYSSTHSEPLNKGRTANITPLARGTRESMTVRIDQEAGWARESVWTFWRR
jgi:hypothetical protein